MSSRAIAMVCGDKGVAPGSSKGAAQHLRGVAAACSRAGHRVTLFSRRPAEAPFPVPVEPLTQLEHRSTVAPDIVYERYSLGHLRGLDAARARGARFVLEVNAPLVDEATEHRPETVRASDRTVEAHLIAEADLVITVSTALSTWVDQHRTGPTVTIPNGFEPSWFRTTHHTPAEPTLVFLGHPKPWHGAQRLPPMLASLADLGHRPRLLVVGGGRGADDIMDSARALGVHEQVTVTGALAPRHATAMLGDATIGLAPYPRREPFYFCPLKVVDYLAAGLPVVATDQGDIADLVRDAGVTVDPGDVRSFVAAVAELLEDEATRSTMTRAGRHRAHGSMTWDHVAMRTMAAIEALDAPALGQHAGALR